MRGTQEDENSTHAITKSQEKISTGNCYTIYNINIEILELRIRHN